MSFGIFLVVVKGYAELTAVFYRVQSEVRYAFVEFERGYLPKG